LKRKGSCLPRVPSGDPERFILVKYSLLDQNNREVGSERHRIGELWEWYPKAKKLADNNIDPLETRMVPFTSKQLRKGQYTLKIKVTKHRMDEKTAVYNKLSSDYPLFIEIFNKEVKVRI
jgi:hypothetical protein